MKIVSTLLMTAVSTLCLVGAGAQSLTFANDASVAANQANRDVPQDVSKTIHFPAGSAVWAILNPSFIGYADINEFSGKPQGGGALRRTVDMATGSGGWNPVSSEILEVPSTLGTRKSVVLQIIPDKPNDSQPFNQLLDMISAHKGPDPILLRVRIEGGDDPSHYTESGFFLDITNGLGRYGEWLAQRSAVKKTANNAFEQQHLQPRTTFVKDYRSLRNDPKFAADVRKWWSEKAGGSTLLSTKACSADYIVMRDDLGRVTEKQLCALVTYKSGTQCFAMMRRFSYQRIGKDTFDSELVDATYANQSLPADEGESFSGARQYEIECSGAR